MSTGEPAGFHPSDPCNGNGSRKRRFKDPIRIRYYACYRNMRFARFLGFGPSQSDLSITVVVANLNDPGV